MNLFLAERVGRLAEEVDGVFLFIFLVGLFFFIITQGTLIYFAIRYHRRKDEEEAATPYITGNRTLEIVWVVVPSILLLAIFIYGYLVFRDIRTPPPAPRRSTSRPGSGSSSSSIPMAGRRSTRCGRRWGNRSGFS